MATLTAIRNALGTAVQGADTSLEVYQRVTGQINSPAAMVGVPERIEFDATMARGSDRWYIPVRIYVQAADYESAQIALDSYLDSADAKSVKTALETDVTLGGVVSTLRVQEANEYGEYTFGNITYLGVQWIVEVYTQ